MGHVASTLVRVLRTLAGLERDEPWSRMHIALYGFLFLTALALVAAWLTGTPLECIAGGACDP